MSQSELLFPEFDASREPVHDWYQFVLGYEAQLVRDLLDELAPSARLGVLDPFCGTGTTLVEARKRGHRTAGLDASPVATFTTSAKLQWHVPPAALIAAGRTATAQAEDRLDDVDWADDDAIMQRLRRQDGYAGFDVFGLVDRHWISPRPLLKVLALRQAIVTQRDASVRALLITAMLSVAVRVASNLKFGPEAYCALRRTDAAVFEAFGERVQRMAADLMRVASNGDLEPPAARVVAGDARDATALRQCRPIDVVMTSPPYPTEKDYTRNTRLEMVLLDSIADNLQLRAIKKTMIRSHSKGVYKDDVDGLRIARFDRITSIVDELRAKCRDKNHGFAKQYPKVIAEYFGGMHAHFEALYRTARAGARAAYVVGQQRTYLQTHIPTAECLAELAEDVGFRVDGIETYRIRRGTTGSRRDIPEEVLLLAK